MGPVEATAEARAPVKRVLQNRMLARTRVVAVGGGSGNEKQSRSERILKMELMDPRKDRCVTYKFNWKRS